MGYLPTVTPWDEIPGALAHARRCVAKACELRPDLPFGFHFAAELSQRSIMNELMYTYAEKV